MKQVMGLKKKIKIFLFVVGLLLLITSAAFLFLGLYGQHDTATFEEDAVVVLGAGVKGERVTKLLALRLDQAAEYSEKNPNAVIIVSGGQGPGEDITEALAMERYLIDKGVAAERIVKEEVSSSTYQNLLYSKELLDGLFDRPYKIAVITNDFHIFRAAGFAKRLGLDATHYHAKTVWYGVPYNYARECLAVVKMWIIGK